MTKLTPTIEEMEALRASVPSGPIVVLNLLKFKPDGGREAYARYVQETFHTLPAGTRIVYSGKAGPLLADGEDWDVMFLLEWPSFDMLAGSLANPEYQSGAANLRHLALERTQLMVTYPAEMAELFNLK